MSTATATGTPVRGWWSSADAWSWTRLLLATLWVVASLTAIAVGQRHSNYADLRAAVSAGQVQQVTIIDALPPGATGYALVEVTWSTGGTEHVAEVWQINPDPDGGDPTTSPDEEHPHAYGDIGQQLRAMQPDLRVDTRDRPAIHGDIFGWRVPMWLSLTAVAIGLAKLVVLVRGPQPRWATRWAWFWLSWSYVGTVLFLLLSGPTPGLPRPRDGQRRLTGSRALLISLLLGPVITAGLG